MGSVRLQRVVRLGGLDSRIGVANEGDRVKLFRTFAERLNTTKSAKEWT